MIAIVISSITFCIMIGCCAFIHEMFVRMSLQDKKLNELLIMMDSTKVSTKKTANELLNLYEIVACMEMRLPKG